jgi:hypothetical protein
MMTHKLVVIKEDPPTTTIRGKGAFASTLIREVPRLPTLVTSVVRRSQLVADHVLLLLRKVHSGVRTSPNIIDPILLHEIFGYIRLIVDTRQGTGLQDTNRLVKPGPSGTASALMLFEALSDVSRLADVVLAICEF